MIVNRLVVLVLILGVMSLAAALGFRIYAAGAVPATGTEPGEGRLEQQNDALSGVFRSWALGGRETSTAAQEEALFRLGTARGSRLIALELRRRELEGSILRAEAKLEQVRTAASGSPATEAAAVDEEDNGAPDGEEAAGEWTEAGSEEQGLESEPPAPVPSPEETAAREDLDRLKEAYDKVAAELTPASLRREMEILPEIALLSGGSARGAQMLLARAGQPFRVVDGKELAGLAGRQTVLLIPSGALGRGFGRQLAAYAKAGGTVVCLAQRRGVNYGALPGRLHGFGWEEAESAYDEAVEVAMAHPSTVSCGGPRFSAAIDGFFTSPPKGSEILLRSAANGQPVALTYPFGKGRVVAASLYTDWEAMSRSPGQAEYGFYLNLMLWATAWRSRLQAPLAKPGAYATVVLPIANRTGEMAKAVRVSYLTPEGRFGKPFELDLRMLPKEKDDRTLKIRAPKTPGVWHLVYALVKADGNLLQYWQNAADLAVGAPAAWTPNGVCAAVTCTGEVLTTAKSFVLTLHLWNYGPAEVQINCAYLREQLPVTIPAGGYRRVALDFPAVQLAAAKGYYEVHLSGPGGAVALAKLVTTLPKSQARDTDAQGGSKG